MRVKIGLIFILISALLCILLINNKIQFKNSMVKTLHKTSSKKYRKIRSSEILDTMDKYKELKLEEIKYDNNNAYISVSVSGNIQSVNNIVSNFRKEKDAAGIEEINVVKDSEHEGAEMKLVFKHYEEIK